MENKRYISYDPTQTEKAFDSEGFFKTGDCAEKLGDCYLLHGRANIDGIEILLHEFKQY
jgi:malonyl-CoA/methylmalonyl-CoA synthetase